MIVREFIQKFMIDDIGRLVDSHPFHSFVLMSIGIEFLGKCLRDGDWDDPNRNATEDFNNAISELYSFTKYRNIDGLYDKLRCGLAHLSVPKNGIKLDREGNDISSSPIILGCREMYEDFKSACNEVLEDKEGKVKKDLTKDYLVIDNTTTGSTVISYKEKT